MHGCSDVDHRDVECTFVPPPDREEHAAAVGEGNGILKRLLLCRIGRGDDLGSATCYFHPMDGAAAGEIDVSLAAHDRPSTRRVSPSRS
jgi:hypothetical protein